MAGAGDGEGAGGLPGPGADAVAAAKGGAHMSKAVPLSYGEHTDYGLLTIVNQDAHVSALQVQNAAGDWVDAPPLQAWPHARRPPYTGSSSA